MDNFTLGDNLQKKNDITKQVIHVIDYMTLSIDS